MRPSSFAYHRPADLPEALDLLATLGEDARPIAGGQSLVPMMNLRLARPAHLVDVNGLGLDRIERDGGVLRIGALVRHERHLTEPLIAQHLPLVVEAVHNIGHPTIRRHGSIGGSVAHADPTAELPAMCVLYDATIVASSAGGQRRMAAAEFFLGAYATALLPGEMITAVEFPIPARPEAGAFIEMAERRGDFAIASVGVRLVPEGGSIAAAAVMLCGARLLPVRAPELEAALVGERFAPGAGAAAIDASIGALEPVSDHVGSADFRRALLAELLRRAIDAATTRSGAPR